MIGLDTNVLVRYLTQDDPEQAPRVTRLIESQCTRDNPGRVAVVVLCELVWVLSGAYGYDKNLIADVIDQILVTGELSVEREDVISLAAYAYRKGAADFADYIVVYSNRAAGCQTTYSFDRKLTRDSDAVAVPS